MDKISFILSILYNYLYRQIIYLCTVKLKNKHKLKDMNYKKILMALAVVALCASCEQDVGDESTPEPSAEKVSVWPTVQQEEGLLKSPEVPQTLSKPGLVLRKKGEVYVMSEIETDDDFELVFIKHSTIKLKNATKPQIQEWLLEDLRTTMFANYYTYPGDTDGSEHGYFYQWEPQVSSMTQSEWDALLYNAEGEPETQFHLPTESDMLNLISIVGNSTLIPQYLKLKYDGTLYNDQDTTLYFSHNASFWYNDDVPIEGCGVMCTWYDKYAQLHYNYKSDRWNIFCTNIPYLHAHIRLVRTLTTDQW